MPKQKFVSTVCHVSHEHFETTFYHSSHKMLLCSQTGHWFRSWLLFLQTQWNLLLCFVPLPWIQKCMCSGKTVTTSHYSKYAKYTAYFSRYLFLVSNTFQYIKTSGQPNSYAPPDMEFQSHNLTD